MSTQKVEGTSKVFDYEILDGILDHLQVLVVNEINNQYPEWTGSIQDWVITLPQEVEFSFSALIEVEDAEE